MGSSARRITLVAASKTADADRAEEILKRWPLGASRPHLLRANYDEAFSPESKLTGSAVLALEDGATDAAIYKLVDRLEESRTPGLVLTTSKPRLDYGASGILSAPASSDAGVLAGMLHALLGRQAAVDELTIELAAVRRMQGGLADQMGKMHEELQLAATVQREFLPSALPETPGLEFGVLFRPCGYVSGDIYNVQRLDERRVGFFVADAVGHGVPAALMTMVLCRGLPMIEPIGDGDRIIPPSEAMARLNEALLRGHNPARRFATAVYGVVDRLDRTVTLAGAGHPPPLRLTGDGGIEPVETQGALLGVFDDAEFDEATFTLDDDEALLVFSDGFEMAFGGDEERAARFSPDKYLEQFVALNEHRRQRGMAAAIESLRRRLDAASGSLHQADDLTALVIAGEREAGEARVAA